MRFWNKIDGTVAVVYTFLYLICVWITVEICSVCVNNIALKFEVTVGIRGVITS